IVGSDPESELALLKVDMPDLPSIALGRSDGLQVGEVVLAIGNSLGLSQTVTMGIVSATGRGQLGITEFEDFIQTDAAINVGNSGGALVNSRGELVGINTATISAAPRDSTMPEGIGFAIPVNLVRGVMEQLIANGRVIRGYLGVDTSDLPESQARQLGIDGSAVLLREVSGPAAVAGLKRGDVLTHINGQRMFTGQQAMNLVASSQPGAHIKIRVARPSGAFQTEAVLDARAEPPELVLDPLVASIDVIDPIDDRRALGLQARENERRGRAQIGGHDLRSRELRHSAGNDRITLDRQIRAEPLQLERVLEAVLEDRLGDRRGAVRDSVQRAELRLHVGREARVRRGHEVHGLRALAAHVELDRVRTARNPRTGLLELLENRVEVLG